MCAFSIEKIFPIEEYDPSHPEIKVKNFSKKKDLIL